MKDGTILDFEAACLLNRKFIFKYSLAPEVSLEQVSMIVPHLLRITGATVAMSLP
jgi:hypothetical protein